MLTILRGWSDLVMSYHGLQNPSTFDLIMRGLRACLQDKEPSAEQARCLGTPPSNKNKGKKWKNTAVQDDNFLVLVKFKGKKISLNTLVAYTTPGITIFPHLTPQQSLSVEQGLRRPTHSGLMPQYVVMPPFCKTQKLGTTFAVAWKDAPRKPFRDRKIAGESVSGSFNAVFWPADERLGAINISTAWLQ